MKDNKLNYEFQNKIVIFFHEIMNRFNEVIKQMPESILFIQSLKNIIKSGNKFIF